MWQPDTNAGFRLACRLPLCRYAAWSSLAVSELQLSAATPLWFFHRAAIAPELNRIQLSAICRGGQSGKVIDLLAWRCLPLGHPSAASGACAVEQISSSKRQCGKRQVSLKPALVTGNKSPSVLTFWYSLVNFDIIFPLLCSASVGHIIKDILLMKGTTNWNTAVHYFPLSYETYDAPYTGTCNYIAITNTLVYEINNWCLPAFLNYSNLKVEKETCIYFPVHTGTHPQSALRGYCTLL